jgi:hypothetical protein
MSNTTTNTVILHLHPTNTTPNCYIKEAEIPALLKTIKGAEFFSMRYVKKDGSFREATAQLHVSNPRDTKLTPNGTGESAVEALENGRIKYYEAHHETQTNGAYRQCRIDRLIDLKVKGVNYIVIH